MAEWTLASVCQRGLEKMGVCKKDGKRMEMALKKKKEFVCNGIRKQPLSSDQSLPPEVTAPLTLLGVVQPSSWDSWGGLPLLAPRRLLDPITRV